jgi:peptide alpha-N-acetyltransferase
MMSLTSDPVNAMVETFHGEYVSLHVRCSNRAALSLYQDVLGFQ